MRDDEIDQESPIGIEEALEELPLFDDLYLHMQALNLDLVDRFLMDQEDALLLEYMENERTPSFSATFVSALSQLWLFGLYELLRTWRQRGKDVLRWDKEFRSVPESERQARLQKEKRSFETRSATPGVADGFSWQAYERVAVDEAFGETVKRALDRTERLFRRIEAFRITLVLAKHELPKTKNSFARAPGYGRIDMASGSISWEVVLSGREVDRISRREIAEECRRLAHDAEPVILPEPIQEKIGKFPFYSYGIKKVTVTLDDGRRIEGVLVAWSKEVVGVLGEEPSFFDVNHVIDVQHEPGRIEDDLP